MTTSEFISKSTKKHGNLYDYSNSIVNNHKEKVEIICPIHGSFYQNIYKHLLGQGCPKCMYDNKRLQVDNFIKRSNKIHNSKYNY